MKNLDKALRHASVYISYMVHVPRTTRQSMLFTSSVSQSHCQRALLTDETGRFHEFCIFNSERLNKHTKWLIKSNCHMRLNTVALNELVLLLVYAEHEWDSIKAKSSSWNEPFLRVCNLQKRFSHPQKNIHMANTASRLPIHAWQYYYCFFKRQPKWLYF